MSSRNRSRTAIIRAAMETLEQRRLLAQSIYANPGADGMLLYKPQPLGDHLGDYSNVGYMGGTVAIPDVPVKVTISPVAGDNEANIEGAIAQVGLLPLDANGFRGAVYLNPGTYEVAGTVTVNVSGVVLRGAGQDQTIIRDTGTTDSLEVPTATIRVGGTTNGGHSNTHNVIDKYVPVGDRTLTMDSVGGYAVGDTIVVHRPSTQQWINDMGMNLLTNPWAPGSKDVNMERTITRIDGNVITLDAPLVAALDLKYTDGTEGTNTVYEYDTTGRLNNVGIEFIGGISNYTTATDESHSWDFIRIDNTTNAWVRNVRSQHFAYACVHTQGGSKWVTVTDSECLDPVSQITGGRRYSFANDDGTYNLFKNLYTREGRHDYVEGSGVVGPNVFVDSRADNTHADVGPHHRWSTGVLWDNLKAGEINIQDRGNSGTGHGHAGANQVIWNSAASSFIVQSPITAQNWLIGSIGTINAGGGVGFHTDGLKDSSGPSGTGANVDTRSLYYAQLNERMARDGYLPREQRLGDGDSYTAGDGADAVPVDATWKTSVQTATGKTGVGFDAVSNNQLVPFTFTFSIDAGTYVAGASLRLGLKSAGNDTSADRIYFENATRSYTWQQLGLATAPGLTAGGYVIDLASLLPALQDGKLNIAISGNTAIDWATLDFKTALTAQPTQTALPAVADAYVDQNSPASNFGTATTLQTKRNGATDNKESYLRFDLSSLATNAFVGRAYVKLTPTTVGYAPNTFASGKGVIFNRISFVGDDTWTETGINFSNKPASDPFFREFVSYVNEPVWVDLTSLVRGSLAGDKKLSLRLNSIIDSSAGQISFASDENTTASLRPQLVITSFNNTLSPAADAYVYDGAATTNFGTENALLVKTSTSGFNREAYLRFDLSSLAAPIAGAQVRLTPFAPDSTVTHSLAVALNDTWTETGVMWNTRPGSGANPALGTWTPRYLVPTSANVTSAVNSELTGDDLVSFRVYSNTSASGITSYGSRENADPSLRPALTLTNLGPQITGIPSVAGQVNTASGPLWFGIWDAETAVGSLSVSATSTNTTLLPNANITFGGSGADRTFTLTPAANQTGSSTVTITVTDAQGQSATAQFSYSVVSVSPGDGDANPNLIRVVRNGSFVDVFVDSVLKVHQDYATSPPLAINALAGNDTITVDYTAGNPVPAAGLSIDGGADGDIVSVLGSSGADAFALAAGSAGVTGQTFAYAGAEQLDLTTNGGVDTMTAGGNGSVSAATFNLNVSAGSLTMNGGSTLADIADLTVSGGATFTLNGTSQTIDALNGAGTVNNNTSTAVTLTVGQQSGNGIFSGTLVNGSTGALSLTKNGTGKLTLSGSNSYTGLSTINDGIIESGNSAGFVGLSGQVRFTGPGTVHVTGNSTAANVDKKFSTAYSGTSSASTGTFDVDAGATLTMGGNAGASMQTNAGGTLHGGTFTKTGLGTLRITSGNGQLDDPFKLNAGTVIVESATGLGGADSSANHVDMKTGTTLVLRQDADTNFLTPISVVDAAATVNVVVDRLTTGPGVTHSVNALTSTGSFTLNLTAGANVTSGVAGLSVGTVTLTGDGTFNITGSTLTVPGVVGGAFGLTKNGAGTMVLSGVNTYTGATTVNDGVLRIASASGLGAAAAGTSISGGSFTGRVEFVGDITVAEPFTLSNRSSGAPGALTPHLLNAGGSNTLSGNISLLSGGSYWTIQSDAGLLTLAGNLTNANTVNTRTLFLRGVGAGVVTGQILQTNLSLTQLNKEDGGTWTIAGVDNHTGPTNVNGGTLLYQNALTIPSAVNVAGAASVLQLAPGQTRVIKTGSVSITAGGRLDLEDNKLIVTTAGATGSWNGSIYTGITGLVKSGRNGGGWGGGGIVTTMPDALAGDFTTLAVGKVGEFSGIADADTRLFAGQTVHGSDTVVMYTYGGDANLDGTINILDYGHIDTSIGIGLKGWFNGDFNYDGSINILDYGIIDVNIGIQGTPFSPSSSASTTQVVAVKTTARRAKGHIG